MIAASAVELGSATPFRVTGCVMETCSGYRPGQTSIVVLSGDWFTAAWMVVNWTRPGRQVPTSTVVAADAAGTTKTTARSTRAKAISGERNRAEYILSP